MFKLAEHIMIRAYMFSVFTGVECNCAAATSNLTNAAA